MIAAVPMADAEQIGEPAVNIAIFGVFVLITLVIVFRASRNNKTAARLRIPLLKEHAAPRSLRVRVRARFAATG